MVHEMLYKTVNIADIDFGLYIENLLSALSRSYGREGISFRVQADHVCLDMARALPLALIVNECVTNAFKHAFPESSGGSIEIMVNAADSGATVLTIRDNGRGFPEDLDYRKSASLGLELVNLLVGQLNGTIEMSRGQGTTITIRFTR